jgi:hypothetical protein
MKKQTLSDKEVEGNTDLYRGESIREFILNCLADGWDEQFVNPNDHFKAGVQWMKERIVKNAGQKLT